MDIEKRTLSSAKNYGTVSLIYFMFGGAYLIVWAAISDENIAFLITTLLFGLLIAFGKAKVRNAMSGFPPYCFMFMAFVCLFPAQRLMSQYIPEEIIYVGAAGMLGMTVIIWCRIIIHRTPGSEQL